MLLLKLSLTLLRFVCVETSFITMRRVLKKWKKIKNILPQAFDYCKSSYMKI